MAALAITRPLENWEFVRIGETDWRPAVVPGHVHVDLLRHGLIEDPFVRDNEKLCQWVDECDWSYRCVFEWHADDQRPHHAVRFEGLDTVCSVFLNDRLMGSHDNMFVPLDIDVSDVLVEGTNTLRVDFRSAAAVGRERKAAYFAAEGLPEDTPNFDERAFVRKAQYMFGWDWGPRLVSCGIWKAVQLIEAAAREDRTYRAYSANSTVRLVQQPDDWGTSFQFSVDGKPFYALGANWIPDHSFPSQVTPERYRERLQQAKDLGVNMLRVWGGGLYEDDAFYDLCDELGILVWQDFMFACSYYPDSPEWQEQIRREAEYQIFRLRRHPCIALWCGNNECHQVWQDGWGGKDKQPPRFHGEVVYHHILKDAVERLDPGRAYVPGSPFGGDYCNSGQAGDQHFWDVWHGRGDWTFYKDSDARFCSEFGFASSPGRATWDRAGVSMHVTADDPLARAHNKTGKPFEVFQSLVELHYPKAKTLDEWSYYSQLNQRDAMRAAIEHYRFSERCRGALMWQLNDCWPVESWSALAFDGQKKVVAHDLPRLFAQLLLKMDFEDNGLILRACLHNADEAVCDSYCVTGYGEEFVKFSGQAHIGPDECKVLGRFPIESLSTERIWRAQFGNAETVVHRLRPVGIQEPTVSLEHEGRRINLTSSCPLIDVFLEDLDDPANSFEPNFFCLLPGDSRDVIAARPVGRLRVRCLEYGSSF